MFGNLDDTATKNHVLSLTLDEMRKEYERGVESVMNDMSLRGPDGRLKLEALSTPGVRIRESTVEGTLSSQCVRHSFRPDSSTSGRPRDENVSQGSWDCGTRAALHR